MSEQHTESYVVGISAVTNNADEMAGKGCIPALWERFASEKIGEQIPNRVSAPGTPHTAVLYTDMESDETGDYRIVIGAFVNDPGTVPEGMTAHTIPAGQFERFTTRRGPFVEVVPEAWHKIWNNKALKARQAYTGDLELYDERSADPQNAEVDILIGIK